MEGLNETVANGLAAYYEYVAEHLHKWVDPLTNEQFWRKPYPYGNSGRWRRQRSCMDGTSIWDLPLWVLFFLWGSSSGTANPEKTLLSAWRWER